MSERAFRDILYEFCKDGPIANASKRSGISPRSCNAIYVALRHRLLLDVMNHPNIYEGAGQALLDEHERAPVSLVIAPTRRNEVILIKIAGQTLLSRLETRGVRPRDYVPHLGELYLRHYYQYGHLDDFAFPTTQQHVWAWNAMRDGDARGFRSIVVKLERPRFVRWEARVTWYRDFHDEVRDRLYDDPLTLTVRYPPA